MVNANPKIIKPLKIEFGKKSIIFLLGALNGLIFAPIFIGPAIFILSYLCYCIQNAKNWQEAAKLSYLFGFSHFLVGMYWISFGVGVYIEEFWWAIPFALFGLPMILACFISAACIASFFIRNNKFFQFIFCLSWIFFEWVRSWIFTGLPWNLMGYAFSFSDILLQSLSLFGIYGLSFIVIYIATSFTPIFTKKYDQLKILLISSILLLVITIIYGYIRLRKNQTDFTDVKIRLVQPSIPQTAKWDAQEFWHNLMLHIELSTACHPSENVDDTAKGEDDITEVQDIDLIIWSEAALIVPYNQPEVKDEILQMLQKTNAILITGGVTSNEKAKEDFKLYTSMYALTKNGDKLFEYHKSHLVPFGEYIPLRKILTFKKLTHGFIDYTAGDGGLVYLGNLKIKPLICYESIFPNFVRVSNKEADTIINVTNDAWYGNTTGPYQHLQISRARAIENGLPMIRVANNGISAVIDPLGRIIKQLNLNEVGYIDSFIPKKINAPTIFSQLGNISIFIIIISSFLIQFLISKVMKSQPLSAESR